MVNRILMPLDGSPVAESAVPHAIAMSRVFSCPVFLLRVLDDGRDPGTARNDAVEWRLARAESLAYLDSVASRFHDAGIPVEVSVEMGRAHERIVQRAHELGADLVILSTHGRGGGSECGLCGTAYKVVSSMDRSLLLVRAPGAEVPGRGETRYQRILVPVDCTPRGDWALRLAASIAREHGAEIVIVHVVAEPPLVGTADPESPTARAARRLVELNRTAAREYLQRITKQLEAPDLRLRSRVAVALNVPRTLDELAEEEQADLVVVCAHGHSPETGWSYGGVANALITQGSRPLLVFQDIPARPKRRQTEPPSWRARAPGGARVR